MKEINKKEHIGIDTSAKFEDVNGVNVVEIVFINSDVLFFMIPGSLYNHFLLRLK